MPDQKDMGHSAPKKKRARVTQVDRWCQSPLQNVLRILPPVPLDNSKALEVIELNLM